MATVDVNVSTDAEDYPALAIGEARPGNGFAYSIPGALLDALDAARSTVFSIELAIMEHINREHPDATEVAEWLRDHAEEPSERREP